MKKSWSIADSVFFLMQGHGSHDTKYEYELEKALKTAYNAAIDNAYEIALMQYHGVESAEEIIKLRRKV